MTTSKLAEYKKAAGGFVGAAIPLVGAIIALNVLSGAAAHDAALVLAGLTAIAAPLGVAVAPKNGPKQNVLAADVKTLLGNASEIHATVLAAARDLEAAARPTAPGYTVMQVGTTAPAQVPLNESRVTGGSVAAPELEPAGTEGS